MELKGSGTAALRYIFTAVAMAFAPRLKPVIEFLKVGHMLKETPRLYIWIKQKEKQEELTQLEVKLLTYPTYLYKSLNSGYL